MVDILLYAYLFYLGFALSISVYRLWLNGKLNIYNKVLFAPVLLIFIVLDFILNYSVFLIMGWPPKRCHTISDRLAVYRLTNRGYKTAFANFICEKLLNTVDPTGNHC